MDSNALLDAVKARLSLPSDYALAKLFDCSQEAVRKMRERGLSDERVLQCAMLLDMNPGEALAAVRAERASTPAVKAAWLKIAESMRSALGALAVVAICNTALAPQVVEAAGNCAKSTTSHVMHYARFRRWVRRLLRSWRLLGGLVAAFTLGLTPAYATTPGPVTVSFGTAQYDKGDDGDWRYDALPHRIENRTNAYRIGWHFDTRIPVRLTYADLGEVSMTAQNVGDEWLGCYPNCRERQVDYATARTKSFALELLPETTVGELALYATGGLHYYQTAIEVSHHHSRNMIATSGDVVNETGVPRIDIHTKYEFEKRGFAFLYGVGARWRGFFIEAQRIGRTQPTDSPFDHITTFYAGVRAAF